MQYLNHEYWNKHIYTTQNEFEECVREETAHLATLKSKKYMVDTAEIETGMEGKSSTRTRPNRWQKLGLVWRNWKKISQIINAYLYLPLHLLINLSFGNVIDDFLLVFHSYFLRSPLLDASIYAARGWLVACPPMSWQPLPPAPAPPPPPLLFVLQRGGRPPPLPLYAERTEGE